MSPDGADAAADPTDPGDPTDPTDDAPTAADATGGAGAPSGDVGLAYGTGASPFAPIERPSLLHRTLPVLSPLRGYGGTTFRHDAVAGLTVAALAIPSSMGFAEVAGLPPVAGLYALLLPVLAYAALGTSRQLVVGPEATSAALVATALAPLSDGDPARYLALASMLALVVGGAFLLARVVRLGWIADYLSRAALVGFTHGVAVILVCGQLAKLTGVTIAADKPIGQVADLVSELGEVSLTTLATSAVALAVLFGLRVWVPKAPGALIVVVGAIVAASVLSLDQHGVADIGAIPSGLPSVGVPRVSLGDLVRLVPGALGIVFAVYGSSILTARSVAGRHGQHISANQELLALGVANLTAGISQSFPMGNSNSRTAVNEQMGVRTQLSGLFAATGVAVVLVFLTGPMSQLPAAVLGAVIVYAAAALVTPRDWRALRAVSKGDVVIAVAALVGVVLVGVLEGILVAVGLSVVDVVRRSSRPHDAVLGWMPSVGRFTDISVHPDAEVVPGVVVYRLDDRLFFANTTYVKARVREAIAGAPSPVAWLVFDAEGVTGIDSSGTEALEELITELAAQQIGFVVARLKDPVRERFDAAGLTRLIGADRFHGTVRSAVHAVTGPDTPPEPPAETLPPPPGA